jgi:death-on-curing protein
MASAIHDRLLAEFGGLAGTRDEGLLESALARPHNVFHYGEDAGLFQLAASYCHGIVRNHPFIDGNKRTGFVVARVFLLLNGVRFSPAPGEPTQIIRALAAGEIGEAELARWFEANSAA